MALTSYVVVVLLLAAGILTWLVRGNWIFLIACMLLSPLPAAAVLILFAERFSFEPPEVNAMRIAVAVPVCYAVVWLALLAGWLSSMRTGNR